MFFPSDYPVELQNLIVTLSTSERENPELVLADFFDNFHLRESQHMLWQLLVAAFSSDTGAFETGLDRNNLMFFYERLVKLVEAAHAIYNRSDFRGDFNHVVHDGEMDPQEVLLRQNEQNGFPLHQQQEMEQS